MQFNSEGIDTSTPNQDFEPVPEGWYSAMITGVQDKMNNAGTGSNIVLDLTIMSGPKANENLRFWISYDNPSAKTVEIAAQNMARLCEALGIPGWKHESEIINKKIEVHTRPDGSYNKLLGFKAAEQMGFADMEDSKDFPPQQDIPTAAPNPWQK